MNRTVFTLFQLAPMIMATRRVVPPFLWRIPSSSGDPDADGVHDSAWGHYVRTYWQPGGIPGDDTIVPVMKKLPCLWVIDQGYADREELGRMLNLDWHPPDDLTAGRKYLAATCEEANRISQEEIGYRDARSMCGPLTWRIVKDANSLPYRIGN